MVMHGNNCKSGELQIAQQIIPFRDSHLQLTAAAMH
jgi:hypothetical protein